MEALQKEGGGGDNLAVGWAKPGQPTSGPSEVIPGSVLSPFSGGSRINGAPSANVQTPPGQLIRSNALTNHGLMLMVLPAADPVSILECRLVSSGARSSYNSGEEECRADHLSLTWRYQI